MFALTLNKYLVLEIVNEALLMQSQDQIKYQIEKFTLQDIADSGLYNALSGLVSVGALQLTLKDVEKDQRKVSRRRFYGITKVGRDMIKSERKIYKKIYDIQNK